MIVVLAGGVGAARFLEGLVRVVDAATVTAVVNTGDDLVVHGLHVSPDLDTVTYRLAGASNLETGWGLAGDTFGAIDALGRFGAPTWFRLGDRDLATHLYRSVRLGEGATLSQVSAQIAESWGIATRIVPMSDDPVRTRLGLLDGEEVEFQDYFVRLRHAPAVASIRFEGSERAAPAPGVLEAIATADTIVVAPSNPLVSIAPILSIGAIAEAVAARRDRVVAISPIVAGRALKGPADKLLVELGHESSAVGVARLLAPFASVLVLDEQDAQLAPGVEAAGMRPAVTDTVMASPEVAAALARFALSSGQSGSSG